MIFATEWGHTASAHCVWVDSCAVCLTGAPVNVYCTDNQVSGCHTVPTTGLFGKYLYSGTVGKCFLCHCDPVLTTWLLDVRNGTDCPHTIRLLVKYKQVVGM